MIDTQLFVQLITAAAGWPALVCFSISKKDILGLLALEE